jgi:hypothetical protein
MRYSKRLRVSLSLGSLANETGPHQKHEAQPMNPNYAHTTPVGRIALAMFALVALATGDFLAGLALFVGLLGSLLIFCPLLLLIRAVCNKSDLRTTSRRAFMLAPILCLALWVFSWTNCFGVLPGF